MHSICDPAKLPARCHRPASLTTSTALPVLYRRWYRRVGIVFWPRSKRLLNTVAADCSCQVLRLLAMLNPEEGQGGGEVPQDQPAHQALDHLLKLARQEEAEPGEAEEYEGYSSGDYEMGMLVESAHRRQEDREGRRHWGPEPEATPAELAAAIVHYLSESGARTAYVYVWNTAVMLQLATQLGSADLASNLLKAAQGRATKLSCGGLSLTRQLTLASLPSGTPL